MGSYEPNKREHMARHYGYYNNLSRGKRKKETRNTLIPSILEPESSSKEYRKKWARRIQKIYEVDPLTCPKCMAKMKIINLKPLPLLPSERMSRTLPYLVVDFS
jgi:hypothetical protein